MLEITLGVQGEMEAKRSLCKWQKTYSVQEMKFNSKMVWGDTGVLTTPRSFLPLHISFR